MATNPYQIVDDEELGTVPEYPANEQLDPAFQSPEEPGPYAAPGSPYADNLQMQIGGTPDPQREQKERIYAYRSNPAHPRRFWKRLFADRKIRESVTNQTGQMDELQDPRAALGATRFAPNPGSIPVGSSRVTEELSPSTYSFTRPMTGGTPHRFNGDHFSLADHRRMDAEIYGMAPPRAARSSQRLDVAPWGTNVYDKAPATEYPDEVYQTASMPDSTNRSYRLG